MLAAVTRLRRRVGAFIGGFEAGLANRWLKGFVPSRAHLNTLIAAAGPDPRQLPRAQQRLRCERVRFRGGLTTGPVRKRKKLRKADHRGDSNVSLLPQNSDAPSRLDMPRTLSRRIWRSASQRAKPPRDHSRTATRRISPNAGSPTLADSTATRSGKPRSTLSSRPSRQQAEPPSHSPALLLRRGWLATSSRWPSLASGG